MRRAFPGLLVLLAVATGCGERAEPLGDELPVTYPVTVTDASGEPVTLDVSPGRIVALTVGAAEIVEALGGSGRLVGIPTEYTGDAAAGAARLVRASGLVDRARLMALRADLVVAGSESDREALAEALSAADADLYVQPDRSVDEVVRGVLDLGFAIGEPARARRLAARIRAAAEAVEKDARARPPVAVYVDTGFFVSPPADSLVVDLVHRAGGEIVGLEIPETPASACDVVELGPEIVLRVADTGTTRPLEDELPPCEGAPTPRLVELPADLVTTGGPRVGEALEQVAQALHDDAS